MVALFKGDVNSAKSIFEKTLRTKADGVYFLNYFAKELRLQDAATLSQFLAAAESSSLSSDAKVCIEKCRGILEPNPQ
jgi:hypothetical protein